MSVNINKLTISIVIFGNFCLSWNSVACAKIKKFQFEENTAHKNISINTYMEEVKPLVGEK